MVAEVAYSHDEAGALTVHLAGVWRLDSSPSVPQLLRSELGARPIRRVRIEASKLREWDSTLLSFLSDLEQCCRDTAVEFDRSSLPPGVKRLLELAAAVPEHKAEPARPHGALLVQIGRWASSCRLGATDFVIFLGQTTLAAGKLFVGRARFRRSDLVLCLQEAGPEALPIITLISLLVGLILAFVGAVQLRQFGADVYVANLVGIAMLREMGAMMTGIIMAGRTGAAFAAQLGTMKVTEEIDAMATFGIPPVEALVLPRMLALCLMMPLLCLYSDILGILGGAIVGSGVLDLSPRLYWQQTLGALSLTDLLVGVIKAVVYGLLVAVAGCLRGMQASGSASAVGAAATRAVVTAIVAIVVADGVFAVVLNLLGI